MPITAPDDRVATYNPVVPTTDFPAIFPVFDNSDIKVFVDDVERSDFSVSATYVEGISNDAKAVFAPGITGRVDVVGARAPRRTNRFSNGGPLPIWQQNLALDTVEAELQEVSRDYKRAHKAPYGEDGGVFTAADIGLAQGYAEEAKEARDETLVLTGEAEAARDAALSAVPNAFPATVPDLAALDPSNKVAAYLLAAGREGQFKKVNWDDVATVGAADTANGLIVRSTPDNTKAWARVNTEGWLNPMWFGAKGNGVDNDSAAIEAALAVVGDGQRATILLPPGKNFRLTDDVDVPPGKIIKFMGMGAETSLVTVNGAIDGFIQDNSAGAALTSGIEFSNFRLAGSGGALRGICTKGGGTPGVLDARCQLIHINNMHISGFGEAIRLEKATNFLLTDLFLFGNGFGLRTLNAGDGKVSGVKTGSNTLGGIYVEGGAGGAWDEGFNIHGCHLNGDLLGVVFKDMYYCWLVSTQVGSTTNGGVHVNNADNCIIMGNEISNALGNADGLTFLNSPDRAIVTGNFINGCKNFGAVLSGSRHTFSNNTLTGNGSNSGRDLQLSSVAGSIINGNRFLSTPVPANSVEESGTSDYNIISANNCAKAIVKVGVNTITPDNIQNAP